MSARPFISDSFYDHLELPETSLLDRRIFKRMVLEHGQLTASDKKTLSEDVGQLTWKYTLKASTVQVRPYEDDEREYLEIAVIEVVLNTRSLIFPRDTGHQVKDLILIQNEVLNEQATQQTQFGIQTGSCRPGY